MLLCLDIGFRNTGWVLFGKGSPRHWGCVRTAKTDRKIIRVSDDNAYCAQFIARALKGIVDDYGCDGVIGELPTSGSKGARPANQMGIALGVVASLVGVMSLPVEWVTPTDVKKAAVGKRNASKEEVMDAVRRKFPKCGFPKTKAEFEHIADACGAYLASEGSTLVKLFG